MNTNPWKAKIDDDQNKKARTDIEDSYRDKCRINCGADIIIRNVLPYLLPNNKMTDSRDSSDDSNDESSDSDDSNEEEEDYIEF